MPSWLQEYVVLSPPLRGFTVSSYHPHLLVAAHFADHYVHRDIVIAEALGCAAGTAALKAGLCSLPMLLVGRAPIWR